MGFIRRMIKAKKMLKDFEVVYKDTQPILQFISVNEKERDKQYREFYMTHGIALPKYENITRDLMSDADLRVLHKNWTSVFRMKDRYFELTADKGLIYDAASVPTLAVMGTLNKNGAHVIEASILHDTVMALKEGFSFQESIVIMRGYLDYVGGRAKTSKRRYTFGISLNLAKKLYDKADPNKSWMRDYVRIKEITDPAIIQAYRDKE